MGIPVLIIGKSGTGKSTSLRNMPADTGIINVIGKPLPFKTKIKPVQYTDYNTIKYVLDKAKGTRFVIDDAGYLITDEFMRGHGKNQSGSSVFDLYNNMADHFYDLIRFVSTNLAEDKIVYIMMHEDQSETFGTVKPKTIGKLLDDKVCVEGMFTIVLRSMCDGGRYYFRTQTDGSDVAKSPIGMFDAKEIDNDLAVVDKAIRKYYETDKVKETKTDEKDK